MIRIGIIICARYRNCGGGKCFRALRERCGAFSIYPAGEPAEIIGYSTCGDCPGGNVEYVPAEFKKNGATVIHLATGLVVGYAHPDALLPKYHRDKTNVREIGMSAATRAAIVSCRCQFTPSRQSTEVAPGIRTTGEIPRRHPEEAITEPFCRDPEGCEPDPLLDDQALFLETKQGAIVLLGCAHAGMINTLDHIQTLTGKKPIHAVMGGTHLRAATAERMHWTIRELRRFNIKLLVPMHCTGQKAVAALWSAFPNTCQTGGVGSVFEF